MRLDAAATRLVFGHLGLGEIHIDADTFPQQTCLFDANQQQLNCSFRLVWVDDRAVEGRSQDSITKKSLLGQLQG